MFIFVTIILSLYGYKMVYGMYGVPNCTDPCPNATAMCWDTTMETGACDGTLGPVYTELIPASDCSQGCWKVINCIFQGTLDRSNGNHNAFVKMMWENGTYINSYPNGPWWNAYWGDNYTDFQPANSVTKIEAKGADDWGDFPLFASEPDWEV